MFCATTNCRGCPFAKHENSSYHPYTSKWFSLTFFLVCIGFSSWIVLSFSVSSVGIHWDPRQIHWVLEQTRKSIRHLYSNNRERESILNLLHSDTSLNIFFKPEKDFFLNAVTEWLLCLFPKRVNNLASTFYYMDNFSFILFWILR